MSAQLPFIVEPMTSTDLEQVAAIERVAFSAPWSLNAFRYEVEENEYSTMLVVRQRRPLSGLWQSLLGHMGVMGPGPVQAYGGFWLLVDEIHICTLAVHPKWQGKGLGELVLLSLLEEGIRQDADRATLEVRVSNRPAQELYAKYGFKTVSIQKRYYADNNEDAYIMATPSFEEPEFLANLQQRRTRLAGKLQLSPSRRGQASPFE